MALINTIQIRRQRGSLSASMETLAIIPATKEDVKKYLSTNNALPFTAEELNNLTVTYYSGEDKRINWEITYMVKVAGCPVAFTNGPLDDVI